MKRRFTAALALITALILSLSACQDAGSDLSGSASSGTGGSSVSSGTGGSSVSSGTGGSSASSHQEEHVREVNNWGIVGKEHFPEEQCDKYEYYKDGTCWREIYDRKRDLLTVERSFPTDPACMKGKDDNAVAANIVRKFLAPEAWEISCLDVTSQIEEQEGRWVRCVSWNNGRNEDTKHQIGMFVATEDYTYVYYHSSHIDGFEEVEDRVMGDLQSAVFVEAMG